MSYWPWLAAGAAVAYTTRGRRVPAGCSVTIEDEMVFDDLDGPEGTYRSVARCGSREVGQIQVEVDSAPPATPRCGRNAAAQRRKHRLRNPGTARTSWTGLDASQRRTGLGTKMYEIAQARAHDLGVPLVPDACGFDAYGDPGETSDAAWRVWQGKLGWKGRTAKRCTDGRTDPALWAKVKKEVTAGSKGGKSGQWSARKAQMSVQKYKSRGGTYCGPKTKAQKSLTRWTKEDWDSDRKGDRYLPKKAREALTAAEYRRTSAKKRRDTAKGKQFSKQPAKIARKTAKHRGRQAQSYPWLSLAKIKKYESMIRERGVSKVARSPRGFLTAYKKAGSKTRLSPEWRIKRDGFIARHWTQAKKQGRPLYETTGKWKGTPTRWHLALIAWGFSPDGAKAL